MQSSNRDTPLGPYVRNRESGFTEPGPSERSTSGATTRTRLGRSGLRSRAGCVTCKQRRVRCNEVHPVCGHCSRLQLACEYLPPNFAQRWRQQSQASDERDMRPSSTSAAPSSTSAAEQGQQLSRRDLERSHRRTPETPSSVFVPYPRSGYATPHRFDFNDIFSDLDTSWAGETMIIPESSFSIESMSDVVGAQFHLSGLMPVDNAIHQQPEVSDVSSLPRPSQRRDTMETFASSRVSMDGGSSHLIECFRKIVQPPAAILIGGFERWRRLQQYLCKLSDHSRAVRSSLLCVIELLMMEDDDSGDQGHDRDVCMKRIYDRHANACDEIRTKISKHSDLKPKTREHLLAAIFLLSWFEVIRDQDARSNLFPRHLADTVITNGTSWSRYSQQLLSWLNTLDSKASHLGGEHLLSHKCLEVVSRFRTQITSSLDHGDNGTKDADDFEVAVSDMSPGHSPEDVTSQSPSLSMVQVKQVVLNTILQPALEWYLTTQSYCRRISAHDKHHRKRFTSDDEYEVITACKGLESALFELWDYRPAVISVGAEQLRAIVSLDMAKRLEEIFSVYLASFWILFVYLHRVSWWNLPHSALAIRALDEVWQNMHRAYGEEVNGPLRKVIHPSLLWPLFLFGSECPDHARRAWAIEQLEALGEAKPVLQTETTDADTLPPFKLSSGATRNAKRAAALLAELIKEQDAKGARVDDRDLSMRMFGCYFSIV